MISMRVINVFSVMAVFMMNSLTVNAQIEYRLFIYTRMDTISDMIYKRPITEEVDSFRIEKLTKKRLKAHSLDAESMETGKRRKIDDQILAENVSLMERADSKSVSLEDMYNCLFRDKWNTRDTSVIYFDVCNIRLRNYVVKKYQNGTHLWDYNFYSLFNDVPSIEKFKRWHELVQMGIGRKTKDFYLKREFGDYEYERIMIQYLKQCNHK